MSCGARVQLFTLVPVLPSIADFPNCKCHYYCIFQDRSKVKLRRVSSASPQRRSISPKRRSISPIQCRATRRNSVCKRFARSLGSRSPSPSPAKLFHGSGSQQQLFPLNLKSVKFKAESDPRPPFVVRHVSPKSDSNL